MFDKSYTDNSDIRKKILEKIYVKNIEDGLKKIILFLKLEKDLLKNYYNLKNSS
jgi:hypothetical protein